MSFYQKIRFIITKENSSRLIVFFILMLMTVFFETLGIALVLPAISFVIDSDLNTNSKIINQILFFFNENYERAFLVKFTFILILITFVLKNIILFLFLWWNKNFVEFIYRNICMRLIQSEMNKSYLEYVESSTALTVRNFNEVKAFLKYLENFIILIVESIILFLLIILLLIIEHNVTLIVFTTVFLLVFTARMITKKLIKNYGEERFFRSGEMMKNLVEVLENYKNIKIFNKDTFFIDKFKKNNFIYSNVNKKFQIIDNAPRFWLEISGVTGLCGLVFFLIYFDYSSKAILPILGIFSVAFFRIIPSVLRIVRSIQALNYSDPVMDELLISLKKNSLTIKKKEELNYIKFNEKVELKNLSFSYPNKSIKIFDNLNLTIKKGEKIGIIGRTGAGKSTLLDVMLGFLEPIEGDIFIDQEKLRKNINGWRELIGYVPQKISVINGSIKENIMFGSKNLSEKDLKHRLDDSIKISEFSEVINGLKNGVDTIIGEKGLDLSGGQIQRLAFARALFRKPEILILDESTNALDKKIENKIINNLLEFLKNKTIIMISHNLDTLKFCDLIYELKNFSLNKINE